MDVDRWISFDALLFINEQGQWANFVNGGCEVKLVQSKMNYSLYCNQQGRVRQRTYIGAVLKECIYLLDGLPMQYHSGCGGKTDERRFSAIRKQCWTGQDFAGDEVQKRSGY